MTRPRPDLSRDVIAEAALAVVDRAGAAKFSLRAVAASLGVTPMSLYHHVAGRGELITLMIDASLREAAQPVLDDVEWAEGLWRLACWLHGSARRHPELHALVAEMVGETPTLVAVGEQWVELWRRSGLPADVAFLAANASLGATVAIVRETSTPSVASGIPELARPAGVAVLGDDDATFELAVRGLLEGVRERAGAAATAGVTGKGRS
jgi:AcrR family transcriptional regulator